MKVGEEEISKKHLSFCKNDKLKYPVYSNSSENNGLYAYSDILKIDKDSLTITSGGNIGIIIIIQ